MYNFDEIIDRKNTNSINVDGFRAGIFPGEKNIVFPYEDDKLIRMWIADMEFATPDFIIDAIKERLDKRIFGYTQIYGESYYEGFSNWCMKKYGWSFEKKELVTSNGIIPALYELVEYICKEDEKVLFMTPSYSYFKTAAEYNSREFVCNDMIENDGFYTIDFNDFENKVKDEKTTLLIFCNPHNPSGRLWKEEELQKIAEIVEKYNMWIISDEIHCDLIRNNKKHIPFGKVSKDYKRLITAMAPSKTFNLAGMMNSNIIIRDDELRRVWKKRHYNFDHPLSIAAAESAYKNGDKWLNELQLYIDENLKLVDSFLKENLPKAKFRIPEATYLAWIDLGEYFNQDEDIVKFLACKAGVLVEGENMFVKNSQGHIRLNLACPKATVREALERICEAIKTK